MKLFQCHAVMPRLGHETGHVVRTYLTIGQTWQEARARVAVAEPRVEFVTVPCAMSEVMVTGTSSINAREFDDLRSACAWNERNMANEPEASARVIQFNSAGRAE